jgi:hypothetical protein
MFKRTAKATLDHRDEIVLMLVALAIPLATLPAMFL